MNPKFDYIIGIDPDTDKSGFAVWDCRLKRFHSITALKFWDLHSAISEFYWNYKVHVIIDAGWLNKKSNFHHRPYQSKQTGEKISEKVGRNHQVGILIHEFCEDLGISNNLHYPSGKINQQHFTRITKYQGRTNQDMRDAAMLVYQN